MRTSESKGHWQLYDSSAPFEPEVRNRARGTTCANFGFGALASVRGPNVGLLRDVLPVADLVRDQRLELVGAAAGRGGALQCELRRHVRLPQRSVHLGVDPGD